MIEVYLNVKPLEAMHFADKYFVNQNEWWASSFEYGTSNVLVTTLQDREKAVKDKVLIKVFEWNDDK